MASPAVLLVDRLPRLGFVWPENQGAPRVLRADHRDAEVMAALLAVAGNAGHVRRHQALAALEGSWNFLSHSFRDAHLGILDREDMVTWLFRVRRSGGDPLASAIRPNIWVEFVYRVVTARHQYLNEVPRAIQGGNQPDISGFARAVDQFWAIAQMEWYNSHSQLYMFAEPDLFGDSNDWDGGEEDWGSEGEEGEDVEMVEVTAELRNLAVDDEEQEEEEDAGEPMDLTSD